MRTQVLILVAPHCNFEHELCLSQDILVKVEPHSLGVWGTVYQPTKADSIEKFHYLSLCTHLREEVLGCRGHRDNFYNKHLLCACYLLGTYLYVIYIGA